MYIVKAACKNLHKILIENGIYECYLQHAGKEIISWAIKLITDWDAANSGPRPNVPATLYNDFEIG